MNNVTQNDLSYNNVKLDYEALRKTAMIAFALSLEEVSRYVHELRVHYEEPTRLHLNAQWLEREAKALAIAADTLAALNGGLAREEVEIVNKPPVLEF